MLARLIQNRSKKKILLYQDGSFAFADENLLIRFLSEFKRAAEFHGDDGMWNTESPDISMVPGKTFAYIADNGDCVLLDSNPFSFLFVNKIAYLPPRDYAALYGKSAEMIKTYCRQGCIPGAIKRGRDWFIPKDAPYPIPPERRQIHRKLQKKKEE